MTMLSLRQVLLTFVALASLALALGAQAAGALTAEEVNNQWAAAKKAYLEQTAPFANQPQFADLIKKYNAEVEATGKSLNDYIKLKQANPPATPTALTPVMDQLYKNLKQLKTLQSQATGSLTTVLGNALKQQQLITQNALKNMR